MRQSKRFFRMVLAVLLAGTLTVAGCGSTTAPSTETPRSQLGTPGTEQSPLATPSMEQSPLPTPETGAGEVATLRMALLPVLDVLPFHVAQKEGFFDQVGVQVQLIPVKSAQERDTLLQTGQVDGQMTDLIGPILFNQSGDNVRVVRVARKAYPDAPLFRLLAAPGTTLETPDDLAGVPIGISQNTVIEYLTDRMLEKAGLSPDQIAVQEVSAIPVRFELLVNGELKAAVLPDPLASGAIAAGAVPVVDDSSLVDLSQSILVFRTKTVQEQPEAVRRFLQAWEMAVQAINTNPEKYNDLLIREGRVPESIQGTFKMPPFPEAGVPSEEQVADVVDWAVKKGLVENAVPYKPMVDDSFLP